MILTEGPATSSTPNQPASAAHQAGGWRALVARIRHPILGSPSDEPHERLMRWVALTTAVFSAATAFVAVRGQSFSTESLYHSNQAVLYQATASDGWSEYQANSLKRHGNENAAEQLRALAVAGPLGAPSRQHAIEIEKANAEKYVPRQAVAQKKAKDAEAARDRSLALSDTFRASKGESDLTTGTLQGAIGLASVAAMTRQRALWFASLAAGVGGIAYFAIGFLNLFLR